MSLDLNNLEPGQTAVYYTGMSIAKVSCENKYTAFQMYMRGEAELTQKKISEGVFEYRITKRREQEKRHLVERREEYYYTTLLKNA